MREIRFRAWDDSVSEMVPWEKLKKNDWYDLSSVLCGEDHHMTVEQFTGLRDKNGKDIFEGDFCELYDPGGFERDPGIDIFRVTWEQAGWVGRFFDDVLPLDDLWNAKVDKDKMPDVTVVGDIHTTPDLLERP